MLNKISDSDSDSDSGDGCLLEALYLFVCNHTSVTVLFVEQ